MEKKRIAVVEDSEADLAALTELLDRYAGEQGVLLACDSFCDGAAFLERYQPVYDLVLMDIEMPGLNGMDTARKLRETDHDVALIFVTQMAQLAIEGYSVSAADFFVKPVTYGILAEKLTRVFEQQALRSGPRRFIYLETGTDSYRKIDFDDICYITKYLNYLIYTTRNGEIRVRGTLRDAERNFAGSHIVKCAKGLMVNLSHIEQKIRNVITVGGVQFVVTKPYSEGFTRAFMAFLRGE